MKLTRIILLILFYSAFKSYGIAVNQDLPVVDKKRYNDVVDTVEKYNKSISCYMQEFNGSYSIKADSIATLFINKCSFNDRVDLNEKKILCETKLNWNSFNGSTNFQNSTFYQHVSFNWSNFNGHVTFKCTFENAVYFHESRFKGTAEFSYAKFNGRTYFDDAIFEGPVDFGSTKFSSETTFKHCQFLNTVIFDNTILPDTFDFSNVQRIDRVIDFNRVQNLHCYINLEGTDISKIRINYNKFRLHLPSLDFDRNCAVYEALLNNFKTNGQVDSYQKLDLEYRDFKLTKKPTLQDRFAKFWWNYGYNKEMIFKWTFCFFSIFFLVNFFLLAYLNNKVYVINHLKTRMIVESRKKNGWLRFFWFRFWLSLLYSSIIFFGIKLDIDRMTFRNILGSIYIYTFYFIGLICLVFIGNYFLFR